MIFAVKFLREVTDLSESNTRIASQVNCTIDSLIQKILDGEKQYDLSKIVSAYELAEKYHHNQKRESGEPYITHPLAVAYILLELGMDTDTICSALLQTAPPMRRATLTSTSL